MPYIAEISRTNPTCFLFSIDPSSSMLEPFGGLVEQTVKFPVWFELLASGWAPMCQALTLAWPYLEGFPARFPAVTRRW